MRPTDQIKEIRSYIVHYNHKKGLHVKPSHWQPGYTKDHCATKEEALAKAIEKAERDMLQAQARVIELHDLLASITAGVE